MTRKEFIKLIKSMPRKSIIKINGKEVDLTLSWNSSTSTFVVDLTEEKESEQK